MTRRLSSTERTEGLRLGKASQQAMARSMKARGQPSEARWWTSEGSMPKDGISRLKVSASANWRDRISQNIMPEWCIKSV
jgi:hypothetical protein